MVSEFLWKELKQESGTRCHIFHPYNLVPQGGKYIRKHKVTIGGYILILLEYFRHFQSSLSKISSRHIYFEYVQCWHNSVWCIKLTLGHSQCQIQRHNKLSKETVLTGCSKMFDHGQNYLKVVTHELKTLKRNVLIGCILCC